MPARVMISSVTKDDIPVGDLTAIAGFWHDAPALLKRLPPSNRKTRIDFLNLRREIQLHLECKYGFDVYCFENKPGDVAVPEKAIIDEVQQSHLVIGLFGASAGWKVPDHDKLTPTFREWRAALACPLKFKVFARKGSLDPKKYPDLAEIIEEIAGFKRGVMVHEFEDAAGLFAALDLAVRDYINKSVEHYARDYAARQPNSEKERWLLLPYRTRVEEMRAALESVAARLNVRQNVAVPVELHCVPDNFSVPESKKFAAYIFDDETEARLHVLAAFGGITDLQIRRHLGNFEAAEVYTDAWGYYATVPSSGTQCVYLPKCVNSLTMESKLSNAITWLAERAGEIAEIAARRSQILKLATAKTSGANR